MTLGACLLNNFVSLLRFWFPRLRCLGVSLESRLEIVIFFHGCPKKSAYQILQILQCQLWKKKFISVGRPVSLEKPKKKKKLKQAVLNWTCRRTVKVGSGATEREVMPFAGTAGLACQLCLSRLLSGYFLPSPPHRDLSSTRGSQGSSKHFILFSCEASFLILESQRWRRIWSSNPGPSSAEGQGERPWTISWSLLLPRDFVYLDSARLIRKVGSREPWKRAGEELRGTGVLEKPKPRDVLVVPWFMEHHWASEDRCDKDGRHGSCLRWADLSALYSQHQICKMTWWTHSTNLLNEHFMNVSG